MTDNLYISRITQNLDNIVFTIFLHLGSCTLARHYHIGISSIFRLAAMIETYCKYLLLHRFLTVHAVVDVIPSTTLPLYASYYTTSLREQITNAVVQNPIGILINGFLGRKYFLLTINRNHCFIRSSQTLINRRIDSLGRSRMNIRA